MTNQGLKQDAWYVPAETATNKTVIVVHGFTNDKEDMKPYAWMFHELGYNVLMPDNMSHGDSEGQIIGYGWNDRLNVIKWAEMLVEQNSDSEITLFGVSMGAATVMMASGEESLPDQVVNIIEDCGYSSVWDELKYQAKEMYNLPAFPILYEVSAISKIRAGFSYGQASSVNQLKITHVQFFLSMAVMILLCQQVWFTRIIKPHKARKNCISLKVRDMPNPLKLILKHTLKKFQLS